MGFCLNRTVIPISIHALTWRATWRAGSLWRTAANFYPRPHMEGDSSAYLTIDSLVDFYPRPHMEGDVTDRKSKSSSFNFYPRPHMEGDPGQSVHLGCAR